MVRFSGAVLFELPLAVASVTTRALQTKPPTQSCGREPWGRMTHLAAFHDSIISSNATIGRICPSFALFLQTGHSCFEVMEFLMHCVPSVVKKFGMLGGNANSPANKSNVRTTRKPAPYRTPCISYTSTKSRDGLVLFAESPKGPRCPNPVKFVGNSSSPSSQKEGGGNRAQRVRVTIVLGSLVDAFW